MARPKTVFLDIDGTLVKHEGTLHAINIKGCELLEGTLEKLNEWCLEGVNIILTSGRKESQRKVTEKQLEFLGITYDQLILGIGGGDRILINDAKANGRETVKAICLPRDHGIKDIIL
jgi:hypothetical protein